MSNSLNFLGEPYLLEDEPLEGTMITFIADDFPGSPSYQSSVISIDDVADEIGLRHEIILISPALRSGRFSQARELESKIESVSVVYSSGRNQGEALMKALDSSVGRLLVFFSPDTVYDLSASDVLIEFIRHRDKKLLLSNLRAFPKSLLEVTGGIHPFRYGALTNLFARMANVFGIITCQVPGMNPVRISSNIDTALAAVHGSRFKGVVGAMAANGLHTGDSGLFVRHGEKRLRRFTLSIFLHIAVIASRVRYHFMKRAYRGSFVHLAESAFESMVLEEYRRFTGDSEMKIEMSDRDLDIVRKRSVLWERSEKTLAKFISLQHY